MVDASIFQWQIRVSFIVWKSHHLCLLGGLPCSSISYFQSDTETRVSEERGLASVYCSAFPWASSDWSSWIHCKPVTRNNDNFEVLLNALFLISHVSPRIQRLPCLWKPSCAANFLPKSQWTFCLFLHILLPSLMRLNSWKAVIPCSWSFFSMGLLL